MEQKEKRMKFLILEWSGYMQADLEDCLHRMGIDTIEYGYRIENFEEDEYFIRTFRKILSENLVDAVMMMNYMAPLAVLCAEMNIPYISWIYDCPFGLRHPETTIGLPTNHIFFFDRAEAESFVRKGFISVQHMPLAVASDRLDNLLGEQDENGDYISDISFVGQMYGNQYQALRNRLDDYRGGFVDSVIQTQSMLYGAYVLHDSLSAITDESCQELFSDLEVIRDMENEQFLSWMEHIIAREITRRERLMILRVLSNRYRTVLYSPVREEALPNTIYGGVVSAYDEAPFVYRRSKINLNMTLKDVTSGMSLRVLEILGSGGFLLSNWQTELAENFVDGEEVVMYDSVEDAITKAGYYISHEEERKRIAKAGYKAVKERFSFDLQVGKIVRAVFGDIVY